jgi:hypothetical protein
VIDDQHPASGRLQLLRDRHVVVAQELEEVLKLNPVVTPAGKLERLQVAALDPADDGAEVDAAQLGDVAGRQIALRQLLGHVFPLSPRVRRHRQPPTTHDSLTSRDRSVCDPRHDLDVTLLTKN